MIFPRGGGEWGGRVRAVVSVAAAAVIAAAKQAAAAIIISLSASATSHNLQALSGLMLSADAVTTASTYGC